MKKKIAFMAPETKWWPYYVYKDIVEWLKEKYNDKLEVHFFNSKKDWLKLHIAKYDIIFSVVPFLFKPIWAKKYIYILVWNYIKERKINRLWNKLLYLSPYNLHFSNQIILMNNYLINKIPTLKKYINKIVIIPNFIDFNKFNKIRLLNISKIKENLSYYDEINILTITWFKFYDKAKWIINLKNVLVKLAKQYNNKKIIWNIAWNSNNKNFLSLIDKFNKIKNPLNLTINFLWWINEDKLLLQYRQNDIFLYWTYLDVFPTVLLEASASWLPLFINNFDSFDKLFPKEIICNSEEQMLNKIINSDLNFIQNILIKNSKKFDINIILKDFIKIIEN